MAKAVERELVTILGKAKGGSDAEGEKELKLLKDRARLLLDVSGPTPGLPSSPLLLTGKYPRAGLVLDRRTPRQRIVFPACSYSQSSRILYNDVRGGTMYKVRHTTTSTSFLRCVIEKRLGKHEGEESGEAKNLKKSIVT